MISWHQKTLRTRKSRPIAKEHWRLSSWQPVFLLQQMTIRWSSRRLLASVFASRHATFGTNHDDVIKWKHFPSYWPFVRGIPRGPVNSPHKGQWHGALMFSLNKRLSKQSWGWWFETLSRPLLWRHCNVCENIHVTQHMHCTLKPKHQTENRHKDNPVQHVNTKYKIVIMTTFRFRNHVWINRP